MKLSKIYEPNQYEPTTYALWESSGAFKPTGKGEPYSVVMPPPNANGNLHVGHALATALEDILVRYHRMKGYDAIFIPGADHAGFETWVVFEKQLAAEGKSRFDFTREEIFTKVWDFVAGQRGNMELQLRALGASASWDDLVFTLDEKVVTTVYKTFKKLWDDKLIYRGERIVNFCTFHQTGFADIEVEHKEEKGSIWNIAYPLTDKIGEIVVATTRPETLLGDTAIAVHPDDPRYKDYIGKHAQVPIVNREIPIIADETIDPSFGTGAVKVTPAHDPTDFEIGERHSLPHITVIGNDGTINCDDARQFNGKTVLEARDSIVDALEGLEQLRGVNEHDHTVGHCYKCGTIIQPLLKEQWFLKVQPLAEKAKRAVTEGKVSFTPVSKARLVTQYLDNLRDWNLSRQIPWGIPIPAFQNIDDEADWIFDERVSEPTIEVNGHTYKREEDTFDTWFSSSQWPFITTDYLTDGDLKRFYPNSVMETGHDLLDRWVSRMIMLGIYCTDEVPFKDVYMHGMVLDGAGQKMSKSKGNVINPMDIIDTYGSDALRLGVVSSRSAGQSQAFATDKVIAGRNLCNKLWNMARFIEPHISAETVRHPEPQTIADHWVMRQLDEAREQLEAHLGAYRFGEAVETLYHTLWDDVADWYLEASKQESSESMLAWVLETCLKLAHPFAPFVTETIWTTLDWEKTLLISSKWPLHATYNDIAAAEFDQLRALVTETRFVSKELTSKQTLLYEQDSLIADNEALLTRLAGLKGVSHVEQPKGLRLAVPNREAWLEVDDATLYEHQSKLEVRLSECRAQIDRLEGRLSNPSYVAQAPSALVAETKEQLDAQLELSKRLALELEVLSSDS